MKFEIILKDLDDKDLDKINENGTLKIPDLVNTIGTSAFWGLYGLTRINLPKNVTKIESEAFADCLNLHTVYLPENLQELHFSAFRNCKNICTVYAYNKTYKNISGLKEYFQGNPEFKIIKEKEIDNKTK